MNLYDDLLGCLEGGVVLDVFIGLNWTAVVAEVRGTRRCGLASTLSRPHRHGGEPRVPQAGTLQELSSHELASLAREQDRPTLACVGVAAINALLPPPPPTEYSAINAENVIARQGAGKKVAIIGHFPFVPRLRSQIEDLHVLELSPGEGDLPANTAPDILPHSDVIAITSMTLANHTLEGLLALCSPKTSVMLLGQSTPLSEVLFDHGVDLLSGSIVRQIEPVIRAVQQGASFRQIHAHGVELVTMARDMTHGSRFVNQQA